MRTLVVALTIAGISLAGVPLAGPPLIGISLDGPVVGESALAAQEPTPTARARLADPEGDVVATAALRQTPHGVLVELRTTALPAGVHAFHIHETGRCSPPTFESAGGHYAPRGREHGFLNPRGPHAGDMPNIHVPDDGELTIEVLAPDVTLRPDSPNTLFDDDGSALVVHADADDYSSQPAGDAGDRVACGVIRPMSR